MIIGCEPEEDAYKPEVTEQRDKVGRAIRGELEIRLRDQRVDGEDECPQFIKELWCLMDSLD